MESKIKTITKQIVTWVNIIKLTITILGCIIGVYGFIAGMMETQGKKWLQEVVTEATSERFEAIEQGINKLSANENMRTVYEIGKIWEKIKIDPEDIKKGEPIRALTLWQTLPEDIKTMTLEDKINDIRQWIRDNPERS